MNTFGMFLSIQIHIYTINGKGKILKATFWYNYVSAENKTVVVRNWSMTQTQALHIT